MGHARALKKCVCFFDGLLLAAAVGALGSGVYVLLEEYGALVTSALTGSRLYELCTYFLIAAGATSLLAALGGCVMCFESCNKNFFLGCHCTLLILVFLVAVGGGIMALLFKLSVVDDFQNKMKETLVSKYGFHIDSPENKVVTDIWNVMQRKLQCCGVSGDVNSSTSWAIYKLESHWYTQFVTGRPYVPDTCCRPFRDDNICTGLRPIKGLPSLGPPALHNITLEDNPNINTNGCSEKIQDIPKRDILIILIFAAVLATLSIINLTLSLCLCKNPRQYDFR